MTNIDINPYGQGGELPDGYPIANNLTTNSAQQALSARMGKKLSSMVRKNTIYVAAADATDDEKAAADYVCDGTHDEVELQQAITALANANGTKHGGTLLLSHGTFYIDSFPNYESSNDGGSYVALLIPASNNWGYELRIIGDTYRYSEGSGTKIQVSDTCYEGLNSNTNYKIISSTYFAHLADGAKISLYMTNVVFGMPWNQKKIMCIDLLSVNRVYLQFITCMGYRGGYNNYTPVTTNPPAVAAEGCIGIRMTGGSNNGVACDYKNIMCIGFYEGFQVGGEHVIGINLSGIWNVYSYTFGNYPWADAFHHPITLINCCDERSINMPLFAYCGANKNNGEGGQEISLIDFNFERYAPHTPGGQLGESATEIKPGTFHGDISYTIQQAGSNITNMKFWKDGHGQRFITRNSAHRRACSTTVRNGYAPNYLQRIWDTDLGKEVICVDTANKTWKDTMGNTVS